MRQVMNFCVVVVVLLAISSMAMGQGNTFPGSGNVGIGTGTTTPEALLEVEGGSVWLHQDNNGARQSVLKLGDGMNWPYHVIDFQPVDYGGWAFLHLHVNRWGGGFVFDRESPDGNQFMLEVTGSDQAEDGHTLALIDPTANTRTIRFTSNGDSYFNAPGNVGIGTVEPKAKLDVHGAIKVNGTITAREIVVTNVGWADFVFQNDYQLMPLRDVERHIQQHQHLPGIPKAQDVLDKGISLGAMQAKIMQKVEELTLYVITQQKEITNLKEENSLLKRLVSSAGNDASQ